ncbi:hypothetical protein D9M71_732430 [compost metagenome]
MQKRRRRPHARQWPRLVGHFFSNADRQAETVELGFLLRCDLGLTVSAVFYERSDVGQALGH